MKKALLFLRNSIDQVDEDLLKLTRKRRQLVVKIAALKQRMGAPTQDLEREQELAKHWQQLARQEQIPWPLAERMLLLLLQDSYTTQQACSN